MLLGEHGKVRQHGQGHEHPDASQLIIYDQGEYLLMDSGYIGYEEKEPVAHAVNHNLILVDDLGPPDSEYTGIGSDTYLSGYSDSGAGFKSCRSATSYQGTDFVRQVVVGPHGMVVVADRFFRPAEAEMTLLWHGNALGQDFARDGNRAAWSRPGATLHGVVTSGLPGMECDNVTQTHSFHHGEALEHETLRCQVEGASGRFLTLFQVSPGPSQPAVITELLVPGEPLFAGLLAAGVESATLVTDSPEATVLELGDLYSCGHLAVPPGLTVTVLGPTCDVLKNINIPVS